MLRLHDLNAIFDWFLNQKPKQLRSLLHPSDDELIRAIETCPAHFAATISGTQYCGLSITETLTSTEQPFISSSDPAVTASINVGAALASVTADAAMQKAMSTGTGTVDLTSLTSVRGTTGVTFSGKKVKYALIRNPSGNSGTITVAKGASNGAATFGAAFNLVLQPGDVYSAYLANSESVDATHKVWDLTGTGSEALDIILAAG